VVLLLPAKVAACIRSMFCDSKATRCYDVVLRYDTRTWDAIWRDTASANVWKPPWWSWSVAITASRSKPPTGNAVTPTTGFISIRLGPVAGPTTTTPTNDPLLGWSVVVSEVSGFASLSTRVYAHAPFVNDEGFGLCIGCGCGWQITDFTDYADQPAPHGPTQDFPLGVKRAAHARLLGQKVGIDPQATSASEAWPATDDGRPRG